MKIKMRYLSLVIAVMGIGILLVGAAFIGMGVIKNNYVVSQLRAQNITLGLTKDQIAQGQLVDSAATAQNAANTLTEHLNSISPSYNALMAANKSGKYDPTNPNDLTYTQGLNMQNSFDIAVLGFGVIQETMATGAAMIVLGLAVGATGFVLFKFSRKLPEDTNV